MAFSTSPSAVWPDVQRHSSCNAELSSELTEMKGSGFCDSSCSQAAYVPTLHSGYSVEHTPAERTPVHFLKAEQGAGTVLSISSGSSRPRLNHSQAPGNSRQIPLRACAQYSLMLLVPGARSYTTRSASTQM